MVSGTQQLRLILHIVIGPAVRTALFKKRVLSCPAAVGAPDLSVVQYRKNKGIQHAGIELCLLMDQSPAQKIFFGKDHPRLYIICFRVVTAPGPGGPIVIVVCNNHGIFLPQPLFLDFITDHCARLLYQLLLLLLLLLLLDPDPPLEEDLWACLYR